MKTLRAVAVIVQCALAGGVAFALSLGLSAFLLGLASGEAERGGAVGFTFALFSATVSIPVALLVSAVTVPALNVIARRGAVPRFAWVMLAFLAVSVCIVLALTLGIGGEIVLLPIVFAVPAAGASAALYVKNARLG